MRLFGSLLAFAMLGCLTKANPQHDDEASSSGPTGTTSSTLSGSTTGTTGTTTATATGPDATSSGGSGSTAGLPACDPTVDMCLIDRGLLARYYISEATEGQAPTQLEDAAPDPLPLPIAWIPEMQYTTGPAGAGLTWPMTGLDGVAGIAVAGTKLADLDGQSRATMEVVTTVRDTTGAGSRLMHIGNESESGRFTLTSVQPGQLQFSFNENPTGQWEVPAQPARIVLHLVFDSMSRMPDDRVRLYVDGVRAPILTPPDVQLGDSLSGVSTRFFGLGNREIGGRSIDGELYYAAVYSAALTDDEINRNVELLDLSDDP